MEANVRTEAKEEALNMSGMMYIFPVLFIFLTIYFIAHFKRDVLPNLLSYSLFVEMNPSMIPVVMFEFISMIVLFWLLFICVRDFIKKRKKFQVYMIILLGYYTVFLIADYFGYNAIALFATSKIAESFNVPYRKLIYRSLILSALFIPYLIFSKRLKNTFVK